MRTLRLLLIALAGLFAVGGSNAGDDKDLAKLEKAWREMEKTVGEGKEKESLAALRSFLPIREDFNALFPKHAEEMWKCYEQEMGDEKEILNDIRKGARVIQKHGAIARIFVEDTRAKRSFAQGYEGVLSMMPKGSWIIGFTYRRQDGTPGKAGPFVLAKDRWILIPFLDGYPKRLEAEAEKKGKK